MEFFEKIGPASYSLLNRFLETGDLSGYNFNDLFYAIENATDLAEFFALAEESKSLTKNKDIISKRLLQPLAGRKSRVILSELFLLRQNYLKLFPDFKAAIVTEKIEFKSTAALLKGVSQFFAREDYEIAFYNSVQHLCKKKSPNDVRELTQNLLKGLLTDTALYMYSDQIQKMIGTLVHSANPDIRSGVENVVFYLIEEVNVFDINEKPKKTPISYVLANYLLQAVRHDERAENEKRIGFVENSLNLMEETTFSAKLKALFRRHREDPLLIGLLMELIFAIGAQNPKQAIRQLMQQIYDSLKEDKRVFNGLMKDWKQVLEKEEEETAEQILVEEIK